MEVAKADSTQQSSPGNHNTPNIVPPVGEFIVKIVSNEAVMAEQGLALLEMCPRIFQRGGVLVHIPPDPDVRILDLQLSEINRQLSKAATWLKYSATRAQWEQALIPDHVAKSILAMNGWPGVRHLEGVVDCPIVRPDGTISQTPGYDEQTQFWYSPLLKVKKVPEQIDGDTLTEAKMNLEDALIDFPFKDAANYSAYLAALITVFVRTAFNGVTPFFLCGANVRGSGKGRLLKTIGLIATGQPLPTANAEKSEEMMQKKVTTFIKEGARVLLFDNLVGSFGSPFLDMLLTSDIYTDRVLTVSKSIRVEMKTVIMGTGNNVTLAGDMGRRTIPIDLESNLERPEDRDDFKHRDLDEYILANRAKLVWSVLVIIRSWYCNGKTMHPIPPLGTYERWSNIVRQIIVDARYVDPIKSRQTIIESGDVAGDLLARFSAQLQYAMNRSMVSCASANQIIDLGANSNYLELKNCLNEMKKNPRQELTAIYLSKWLKGNLGRVVNKKKIVMRMSSNLCTYFVQNVKAGAVEEEPEQGQLLPEGESK